MQGLALLDQFIALAEEAGLRIRRLPAAGGADGEGRPASGTFRLRDEWWILLSGADSVEERTDVVVNALRTHCGEFLETRFLAPAVRERLGQ